jgi:hypothetical protein
MRTGVPRLPTRVINVGTSDDDVRLETETADVTGEYVALSHVWGGVLPIRLTASTLEEKRKKLVFDDASKTLQEAVDVTRRLGIPYIWIDSLCIIQEGDGGEDWNREAPKMSDIYNMATLTISAGSSKSSATGLFPSREDRSRMDKKVIVHESPAGNLFARFRYGDPFSAGEAAHSSSPLEAPQIRSRGWVLQEDLLSPRILQFRKEEMTWTCSTYSRCECRLRPSLPLAHPFRAARGLTVKNPERSRRFVLEWPSIVMDYTRRELTKPEDRMMALAGLADYMEEETTDTYYGGLWYEDISFGLLWRSDNAGGSSRMKLAPADDEQQKTRFRQRVRRLSAKVFKSKPSPPSRLPISYAPSWSWTSISGPVSYFERYPVGSAPSHPAVKTLDAIDARLKVLNLVRFPAGNTVFGPLVFCPLSALGLVLPITYDQRTKQWQPETKIDDLDPANLIFHIDVSDEDPTADESGKYALVFAGEWKGQGFTIVSMQCVCILVRLIESEAFTALVNVAYERVGLTEEQIPFAPSVDNSYTRVGLVRGAGSLDAWAKRGDLIRPFFLF